MSAVSPDSSSAQPRPAEKRRIAFSSRRAVRVFEIAFLLIIAGGIILFFCLENTEWKAVRDARAAEPEAARRLGSSADPERVWTLMLDGREEDAVALARNAPGFFSKADLAYLLARLGSTKRAQELAKEALREHAGTAESIARALAITADAECAVKYLSGLTLPPEAAADEFARLARFLASEGNPAEAMKLLPQMSAHRDGAEARAARDEIAFQNALHGEFTGDMMDTPLSREPPDHFRCCGIAVAHRLAIRGALDAAKRIAEQFPDNFSWSERSLEAGETFLALGDKLRAKNAALQALKLTYVDLEDAIRLSNLLDSAGEVSIGGDFFRNWLNSQPDGTFESDAGKYGEINLARHLQRAEETRQEAGAHRDLSNWSNTLAVRELMAVLWRLNNGWTTAARERLTEAEETANQLDDEDRTAQAIARRNIGTAWALLGEYRRAASTASRCPPAGRSSSSS